jgi:MerR family transcriptional regulator, light-induced transcriptional regulator
MADPNKSPLRLFASRVTSKYTIKDLERVSGIKAHTLRIWEQRYSILRPERTDTNIRFYDDEDLKRILNISLLNNNGYKISEIARLQEQELLAEVNRVLNNTHKESVQVENLVLSLLMIDEDRFEATLNNSIMQFGFESTIENIVFPFLRQLGNMWQVGIVSPAQEHYISNLVRQKLIVGLDRITPPKNTDEKVFLLFLPDQELHELGLIYAHYLAKLRGHRCLYLGQSLPTADLVTIACNVHPDYMITILTSPIAEPQLLNLLDSLQNAVPSAKMLVSGRLAFNEEVQKHFLRPGLTVFKDFADYKKLI